MPLERLASKPSDPPVGPENKKPLSLQPLDLGDPIRYEELRRALGVEETLSRSLDEILAPVDALPRYTSKRHNLFTPFADMPASLLLPYAVLRKRTADRSADRARERKRTERETTRTRRQTS